jgi:hypothetical protein
MDYSAWYAFAKGENLFWFLVLVLLAVGLGWAHYKRAGQDLLCEKEISVQPDKEEG